MLKQLSAMLSATVAALCCIVSTGGSLTAGAANAVYDTEPKTYASDNQSIGDVDSNDAVDVMDAASILTEVALLGSSQNGSYTDDQFYRADVDTDGQVDATDASIILTYSSLAGSGAAGDFVSYLKEFYPSEDTSAEPTVPSDPTGLTGNIVSLTNSEATMLAALVTLEAGNESYECQKAVASLIVNRMLTSGTSLNDVIYAKNQFSTAGRVASTTPFNSCVNAVNEVLATGTTIPIYVTFFRASYYHSWGDQVGYCCIDNTYFSYSQALKNKYV